MRLQNLVLILVFIFGISVYGHAQKSKRLNGLSGHVLFLDHQSLMEGQEYSFDEISNGLEIAYHKYINNYIGLRVPFKAGLLRIPDVEFENRRTFVSGDVTAEIRFFKKSFPLYPYIYGGIGVVSEEDMDVYTQIPVGFGLNFKIGPWGYLSLKTEYRQNLDDLVLRDNIQYGIGLAFMLGKPDAEDKLDKMLSEAVLDTDGDGVVDSIDYCVDIAGVAAFRGCPDTDTDGIGDDLDNCPEVFGVKSLMGCPDFDEDGIADLEDKCSEVAGTLQGCPDMDNDGIADDEDECPEVAGILGLKGCPEELPSDMDSDGVVDADDRCPEIAGLLNGCPDTDGDGLADVDDPCPKIAGTYNGCPDTAIKGETENNNMTADSDGDGILNERDACPNAAGPVSNNGCPDIPKHVRSTLDYAMGAILFETASDEILSESFSALDDVVDILNQNPSYHLKLAGHTDNVGKDYNNRKLSEKRAKSCLQYLASKGIDIERFSYIGFGETKPIADNSFEEGRKINRRVEFELLLEQK